MNRESDGETNSYPYCGLSAHRAHEVQRTRGRALNAVDTEAAVATRSTAQSVQRREVHAVVAHQRGHHRIIVVVLLCIVFIV